jgi:hypothetical protein
MSVRPSQGTDDEPDVIEFGIAAFDAHLDGVDIDYPVSANDLVEELDDPEIPIDAHGNSIVLSDAIEDAEASEFESERKLKNALHPVFESRRERAAAGVLASIRTLLPF